MAAFNEQLLDEARSAFIQGQYNIAEPILNQPSLAKNTEAIQMLSTIYYDQGKFNKAIGGFKKALEIDPSYTDAAVGLSIILNDIGRYDEAKKIFEQAQSQLDFKKLSEQNLNKNELGTNQYFSKKHAELADMYLHHKRYQDSTEQYLKALSLTDNKADLTMQLCECYLQSGQKDKAIKELKILLQVNPKLSAPRLKLGLIMYNSHHIAEAVDQWENILRYEPKNPEALRYLKMAQAAGVTNLNF